MIEHPNTRSDGTVTFLPHRLNRSEAAFRIAAKIDRARGIESLPLDDLA